MTDTQSQIVLMIDTLRQLIDQVQDRLHRAQREAPSAKSQKDREFFFHYCQGETKGYEYALDALTTLHTQWNQPPAASTNDLIDQLRLHLWVCREALDEVVSYHGHVSQEHYPTPESISGYCADIAQRALSDTKEGQPPTPFVVEEQIDDDHDTD